MENFDAMRLDGHSLRVFVTVCETGSISRTAEIFGLNQSTISHTIDKLRAAVDDPLFVKSGRNIAPTERALALVPKAQEILASIEGLTAKEDYDPLRDTRPVSVAIPTPALMQQMKAVHGVLRHRAPQLLFRVARLAPRERLPSMLINEEVDMGIAVNLDRQTAELNACRYGQDALVVYYDPSCRGPLRGIDDYLSTLHAVADFGGTNKSIVDAAFERHGLRRKIGFVAPTASTLGEFLAGTKMVATMPLGLAKGSYSNLAHCPCPIEMPPLRYDLVWHRRFEHSGRNAWIRQVLLEGAQT